MKILKWLFLAIPASLFLQILDSKAQTPNTDATYTINGSMTNMQPVPSKMYLMGDQKTIDSALVINGVYKFTEPFNGFMNVQIMAKVPRSNTMAIVDMASFFVNKGMINVVSDKSIGNFKLSGPGADIENDYNAATVKSRRITDSLKEVMHSSDFQTNTKKQESFRISFSNIFKPVNDEMLAYLKIHPSTPAGPIMIQMIAELPYTNVQVIDSLLNTMPADLQAMARPKIEAEQAKKKALEIAKAENDKKGAVGSQAIDFAEPDTKGQEIKLSSLRGKYVLVDFWASWCGPCRAENPNVVTAYNKYKDKGFTVLGVSLDGSATRDAWLKAIDTDGLAWTQVSDLKGWKNSAALVYGVSSIPQNFLIDPNGVIIGKNLRGNDLNAKLVSIFK